MLPLHCRCISIPTGSFDSPYRLVFAWFGPPITIFNFARKVIRLPLVFHWRIAHIWSSLSILGYDGMLCTILFPGWYTFRYLFIEAVILLLLAFQGSMIQLLCWFGLLICWIFTFCHLVWPLGDGWNAGFWCILTVDVPFYHSLTYFGLVILISELSPACLTGISGCFFSLVFLFACFSFLCSLWLAFQVLPGPCILHRPGGIPRIALGKEGKKRKNRHCIRCRTPLIHSFDAPRQ